VEALGQEEAREILQPALDYAGGTHLWEDIHQGIAEGRYLLWPGVRSAILTEIIEYPRQRTLHFFLAGGNIAELEAMVPGIIEWGRSKGCTSASLTGRMGWSRSFLTRTEGWKSTAVVMTKEL
jgi:hypothetical protein